MAIGFNEVGAIGGISNGPNVLTAPTSLQFGPDGRLYVSEQNGSINAFTITTENGEYIATAHEELTLPGGGGVVKSIQNHNDDGSLSSNLNRQVTGIVVTGTAENPVLYITSSDPRIAKNADSNLDTNSGVLTKVTWTGTEWDAVDLIRGLPRSEENHSNNGMVLSDDGTKLYLMVGGNTNNGAPSKFFAYTGEYALSGVLLEIDLVDLESRPTQTDAQQGRKYVYDLPTLDDPNVENVTDGVGEDAFGMDEAGPWGGNDGLNMAVLPSDAPMRIYADGFRNAYDVTLRNGELYTVDNGSNANLGGDPVFVNGEATNQPNDGGSGDPEPLHRIDDGGYYGHPVPVRSNQNLAWTVYEVAEGGGFEVDSSLAVNSVDDLSALVPDGVNIQEGFLIDPSKFTGDPDRLLESGTRIPFSSDASPNIVTVGSSTNGITEYTGEAFDGALQGALVVTQFNDNVTLLNINADGTALDPVIGPGPDGVLGTTDDEVIDDDGIFFLQSGLSNPLDVTMGPDGTLWVAEIGGSVVSVLAPTDLFIPGDTDADDDGLENAIDPFVRDAGNGTGVTVRPGQDLLFNFAAGADNETPGVEGYGGGLTGQMIDGTTDPEVFLNDVSTRDGQVINGDNIKFTTAAGGGTTVVEFVSGGDPLGSANTGQFLFHTGVQIAQNVDTFTILWDVFNPEDDPSSQFGAASQQIGGYIGTGDQSNYLKLVAIEGQAEGEIQMLLEDNDTVVASSFIKADGLFNDVTTVTPRKISFELTVDPQDATATPTVTYETDSGSNTVNGSAIALTGTAVLDAILGNYSVNGQTTGLAVGLFASNAGQPDDTTFQAIFDNIAITATERQVPPVAEDDAVRTEVNEPIAIAVADLLANDFDLNPADSISFESVLNEQNGTAAVSDSGTPDNPSDDVITFIPTQDFEGTASFDYTITDGTESDTATVTVDVANENVLYRVNAGGAEVAALPSDPLSSLPWAANAAGGAQSGSGFSVNTGKLSSFNTSGSQQEDASLPDYVPYAVFATERWDPGANPKMLWNFDVTPGGTYTVRLYVRNGFDGTSQPGERVFDVEIEGATAFTDVDLSGSYGHQTAAVLEQTVVVGDSSLDIEFLHQVDNPLINAIEIIQLGGTAADTPVVSIVSGSQTVPEDVEGGQVQISLVSSLTVPSGETVDVTFEIVPGSATPGADYAYGGGSLDSNGVYTDTVSIAGSSSDVTFLIDILDDAVFETDETFDVNIVSVSSNAVKGFDTAVTTTIVDNDLPPSPNPGDVAFRLNAGGPEVAANDGGLAWSADQAGAPSAYLVAGGNQTYTTTSPPGPGTNATGAPDALFFSERYSKAPNPNNIAYAFPVANGDYIANLYFDEIFHTSAGSRVFDVEVENSLVLDDFDPYAVGGNDTILQSFPTTVSDGELNIQFFKGAVNSPHIAAIEIVAAPTGPVDRFRGVAATDNDFSDDNLNPDDVVLELGANTLVATGEFGDSDYVTFEIIAGQQLTAANLLDYVGGANATFLGIQQGETMPTQAAIEAGNATLDGGTVYTDSQIGDDLLPLLTSTTVEGAGQQTNGLTPPLGPGRYTLWFNQNQSLTETTLELVTEAISVSEVGATTLSITDNDSFNVQKSNFGNNSFQVSNVGTKDIAKIEIDVTNALYPDSVFDPFGVAGDTAFKLLQINTSGNTGVQSPDHGTNDAPGSAYIGAGGTAGFEGIQLTFDAGVNGGFNPGETLGFSVDMDPNSIAGLAKGTLDSGTDPNWDVGGVSGAELIGSSFTITFTDGSTAIGQLQGANNQAGSRGIASQESPDRTVTLTVNGLGAGEVGTYSGTPTAIVSGPAGETARVVLTKGIIQPVNNDFTGDNADRLDAQLAELAASDFPANNAAEFQTVDIVLDGTSQDISDLFDFTQVPGYALAVPEDRVPLGFTASIIDPTNNDLPQGTVTAPIYLTYSEAVPELTVTVDPSSISEDGGTATVTVTRPDTSGDLAVTLSSSDTSEVTVPATATIADGQTTATFLASAVDDAIADGTQTSLLAASATGFASGTVAIEVTDNDVPTLSLAIDPASISENDGTAAATVTRNTPASGELVVALSSDDTSAAAVPATVTIPDGETAATFAVTAVDDALVDGTQTPTVTATAADFASGAATVDVTDDDVPTLSLTIDPASISENGGAATATVTRNTDASSELAIALSSDDTGEATVPTMVAMAVGQTVATFAVVAVDDAIADGTQAPTIAATAAGFAAGSASVVILDNEVPRLSLAIDPTSISENGGTATATVTRNTDASGDLTVNLNSGDSSEATVPATVTILDGETTATFTVTAVDDTIADGTQTPTIAASATGFASGSAAIDVTDDEEVARLSLAIDPASISENGGTATATVTRNTGTSGPLIVTLSSSDISEATVPETVTILDGQTSATFTVTAVDDAIADGTQPPTITAAATGYVNGAATVDVTDDEVAALSLTVNPTSFSEGGTATVTLTRNTDTTSALDVEIGTDDSSEVDILTPVAKPTPIATIPAGADSVTFEIAAIDDGIVDGLQTATITASAEGLVEGSTTVEVADSNVPTLSLTFDPASISENGGTATATVTRNTGTSGNLTVALTSDDPSETAVPNSVTIPDGQNSATFTVTGVDDSEADGTQTPTIAAAAAGFVGGTAAIDITDDEGEPIADEVVLYRVNAGGAEVAALPSDPLSNLPWAANAPGGAQSGNGFSVNTGRLSSFNTSGSQQKDASLPDYVPYAVFATERWDPGTNPEMLWNFDVTPGGTYAVRLFLRNGFNGTSQPDERIFDVTIEGVTAFDDVDLSGTYGHQTAAMLEQTIAVTDSSLDIEFLHQVENPLVNAIEIVRLGGTAADTPVVSIVSGSQTVPEDIEGGQVQISLASDLTVPDDETVDITFEIVPGSATPEADYAYQLTSQGTFSNGVYTDTVSIAGGLSEVAIPIDILDDTLVEDDETFEVNLTGISDNAAIGSEASLAATIADNESLNPSDVLFRINAGGAEVAAVDGGLAWSGDTSGSPSPFLIAGGNSTYSNSPLAGANTTGAPDELFVSDRFTRNSQMEYAFDNLTSGSYQVNLYFDEMYFTSAGQRQFDVEIEGNLMLDNYDSYGVGQGDSIKESFEVSVTDGTLNVAFLNAGANNPHVAALEVIA